MGLALSQAQESRELRQVQAIGEFSNDTALNQVARMQEATEKGSQSLAHSNGRCGAQQESSTKTMTEISRPQPPQSLIQLWV